ncbi:hypothetical protein PHLCEN_2v11383 [Hermanssonia centrifuga]|uniref:DNA2/NAM7 helicase-like C-terminal domain-containing protein n=1 Tax=Hermanssonia centrifuga TaxID=98765 RepID=A0A2R6NKD3_9APHY|nr:hypothetical protein PHLCEN_2v11383 [Hermanssonia centrifuga]
MSNSDTFIEQDIFNYSDRLAIRSFTSQDLSRASQAIIDSGSNVLGLSIEYADTLSNRRRTKGKERGKAKGVVRALAIATTDKVYYISFDDSKAMQTGKETAFSDQLALLGRLVLTAHQLESLKPLKVDNEFRAVTPGKPGKLVVECLRYKTRVRKSKQTRVILEDSHGGRVVCQAVTAVGKRTTVVPSKGRYQDGIQRVSVEGREEMTCAEKACDAFILRVLRKEINLHDRPLINTLWFPPPTLAKTPRPKHISPVSPAFCRLNTSQRQVAAAMISTTESVVIAHGPPGTGKTTTIAAAVDYWQQESKPVWIVAQSNVGVKNIARSLVGKSFHGFKLIVSKEFHFEWHEELYARVEHNLIRSDELARTPNPIETERKLAGSRIILCTLSMLSNPFLDDARVYSFVPVERLVVDEASQINVSEYMHLIHKFKKLQKLCFFGDPKQLPPFGQEAAPAMQSIFEVKHLKPRAYFLDTQYRMPIPLGNFISDEVYNKKLKSVHKISDISCVSFVDVDKGTEESCGKSWTNSSEVQVIVTLVRRYYRRKPFAIITPYDPQRAAIQAALEKENLPSDCVYTVDSFQGNSNLGTWIPLIPSPK